MPERLLSLKAERDPLLSLKRPGASVASPRASTGGELRGGERAWGGPRGTGRASGRGGGGKGGGGRGGGERGREGGRGEGRGGGGEGPGGGPW